MNDKEFRKLMKGINDAHSVLEAYQEQVLSHASSIVSKIEKNNQNKDEEALESLRLIKDQLRQVQFTDDKEFESEQLITRIDRITKNTTKGNNARIDNEWDKYFELLEDYMKEKGQFVSSEEDITIKSGPGKIGIFTTEFLLPSNSQQGKYFIRYFIFQNGEFISYAENKIDLKQAGFNRLIWLISKNFPLLYGILAVILSGSLGWLISTILRRLKIS